MLKIFNALRPFFENNYRRINVREYARIQKMSPPTASKLLQSYQKEGILKKEEEKQYFYYFANKESDLFIDLSRVYWKIVLEDSGLIKALSEKLLSPVIIIFGSLSKAEVKEDSDIDIAIFTATRKELNVNEFEKKLKRKIQLFLFKDRENVKNTELLNNILNGYKLRGNW